MHDTEIHEVVWYARTFTIPEEWLHDQDIILHFGAVDYRSTIWVNGEEVDHNQGGHVPFSFDIAPYVKAGDNRVAVRVEDTQDPHQPRGKQSVTGKPFEIDYYCTTGIWQTVWLEPVPQMRINDVLVTPHHERNSFGFNVHLHAPSIGWDLEVSVSDNGRQIAWKRQKTSYATTQLNLEIPNPTYWSPENPPCTTLKFAFLRLKPFLTK